MAASTSWRTGVLSALAAIGIVATTNVVGGTQTAGTPAEPLRVIVGTEPGRAKAVADRSTTLGGRVVYVMSNVDAFVVEVDQSELESLAQLGGVASLAPSTGAELHSMTLPTTSGPSSSAVLAESVNADDLSRLGLTGSGVDVAVIDSGVAPVAGLQGRVVNGPDFSQEGSVAHLAGLDGLGHGTHMAGIIAGADTASGTRGVAPGSRIINVKVAAHDGTTSVESVIRAIDWVVQQRKSKLYNIRVINVSFGVEGITEYVGDPLSIAVEKAWKEGIVVVVSAGNDGVTATSLGSPATNPYVLAVGAADIAGTSTTADDRIASFSSAGTFSRKPDVVAPGVGVVSMRVPGSVIDDSFPEARLSDTLFRGSGTSQSAAVVSGLVALMVQADPTMTPDEIKARLVRSAKPLPNTSVLLQGSGMVDVSAALGGPRLKKAEFEQKYTSAGKDPLKTYQKLVDGASKKKTTQNVETDGAFDGNRWRGNRWRDDGWQGNRWRGDHWE